MELLYASKVFSPVLMEGRLIIESKLFMKSSGSEEKFILTALTGFSKYHLNPKKMSDSFKFSIYKVKVKLTSKAEFSELL